MTGPHAVSPAVFFAVASKNSVYSATVSMRRLKGEFLLRAARSLPVEAAESYREAIEVARRQSAKSLELRATMSLARLFESQGRRVERARCWLKSTAGSPKASTPPT
jgi:hypothetical protein